jgi:hypothetical protein
MAALRFVTFILLSILASAGLAGSQSVASQQPWSQHCSAAGIPARNADEAAYLETAAARCEAKDACILACSRSGCAEGIAGGCAHVCSRGLTEDFAKRADYWAQRPSCRLPPNNSFKPKPLRGSA